MRKLREIWDDWIHPKKTISTSFADLPITPQGVLPPKSKWDGQVARVKLLAIEGKDNQWSVRAHTEDGRWPMAKENAEDLSYIQAMMRLWHWEKREVLSKDATLKKDFSAATLGFASRTRNVFPKDHIVHVVGLMHEQQQQSLKRSKASNPSLN